MHTIFGDSLRLALALISLTIVAVIPTSSVAADFLMLPNGSKLDLSEKCPVCGMIIGGKEGQGVTLTFKDGRVVGFGGVAAAVFKDGRVVGFEGARCLFLYNSVPQKYGVDAKNIAHQFVTDFVSKKMIDLSTAFLVLGSEVKGPMGYDLIPFTSKEAAAKFAAENDGKWIVQLHEVARSAADSREDKKTGTPRKGPGVKQKEPGAQEEESMLPEIQDAQPLQAPARPGGSMHRGGHHMH